MEGPAEVPVLDLRLPQGCTLVTALRILFETRSVIAMTAEQIDKLLCGLAEIYVAIPSPEVLSVDDAHVLFASIVMLNGDLHSHSKSHVPMTRSQFMQNLQGAKGADDNGENGTDFDSDMLGHIYAAVKNNEIMDATPRFPPRSITHALIGCCYRNSKDSPQETKSEQGKLSKRGRVMDEHEGKLDRAGWLLIKPVDNKSWWARMRGMSRQRRVHATLLGSHLLLNSTQPAHGTEMSKRCEVILVRHMIAELNSSGDPVTVRLWHPSGRCWMLMMENEADALSWIEAINFAAARDSAPPLPLSVASVKSSVLTLPVLPEYMANEAVDEKLERYWQSANKNPHPDIRKIHGLYYSVLSTASRKEAAGANKKYFLATTVIWV